MDRKSSIRREDGIRQTNIDGIPVDVVEEALVESDDNGDNEKVLGRITRLEFFERPRLKHLLVPREKRRVVVSARTGEEQPADGVYFVTVEGTKDAPQQAANEDDAMNKARAAIRGLFFGG